jgi:hypothetical protein
MGHPEDRKIKRWNGRHDTCQFLCQPYRVGHLNRTKWIYSYLIKMQNGVIRICVEEPDFSSLPSKVYDWEQSIYAGAEEMMATDYPIPLGKPVVHSTFVDANLYHDLVNGKSVTGIMHVFNKTLIDWYTKKQSTVETATYIDR